MLGNAEQQRQPWRVSQTVAGKVTLVPWEPPPGHVTAAACSLRHFCKEWMCPAWSGQGKKPALAVLDKAMCCR